jgi:hypothetical protein
MMYIELFQGLDRCKRVILARQDPRDSDYASTLKRCGFNLSEPIYLYQEPDGTCFQVAQGLPTND